MRRRILVVDDDERVVELVKLYLERDGYEVLAAYDGRKALELARWEQPDLIILDLMLPEVDGLDVCHILRKQSQVPIIMLTARSTEEDKLVGLEEGADDYVTKPFSPRELVARVRAVLRRTSEQEQEVLSNDGLTLDPREHEVRLNGREVELTPTEFKLLEVLMREPGRVLTRLQLLCSVLGCDFEGTERDIDVHIKNLRKKIEPDPRRPRYIRTVYGIGYKLSKPKADT